MAHNRDRFKPPVRRLRGYAFDPSLSIQLDTAVINNLVYKVEWEDVEPGPIGEYVEVVDIDPASDAFYPPVDLNDAFLLAQDGLNPNVGNPQFHQQMVYAVVMTTINNFEQALGRKIQWADRAVVIKDKPDKKDKKEKAEAGFVQRLRIYPHALRQANAFYHPDKVALLFGYFPARPANPKLQLPGGMVFTCLSHDIIAHETTHAILDGLHRKFVEPTNPDTRAFHEAFADIVALLQHFTFADVLKHQIAKTRGNLGAQNLLGQLAQEFGKATGGYSSLRDAIGYTDKAGEWHAHAPDPDAYAKTLESHGRGAILVAAIFDAFINIYKKRIKALNRVATGGTGVLPEGDLHPDMVALLAETAAGTAQRVLRICVRALDYCPPTDLTFGDYLRAIITADIDMVADDENDYRVAFIEAFQKRGIYPAGVNTMSVEALMYPQYPELNLLGDNEEVFVGFLRRFKEALSYETNRYEIHRITKEFIAGSDNAHLGLHKRLNIKFLQGQAGVEFARLTGLNFELNEKKSNELGFDFSKFSRTSTYKVENLWLASRVTPNGKIVNHVIVTLLQKRGVLCKVDDDDNFIVEGYCAPNTQTPPENMFVYRGGATLVFDLDKMELKYVIGKSIDDMSRLEYQYRYRMGLLDGAAAGTYFDDSTLSALSGPFSFMHSFHHH